eukprot:TRINITY_DN6643_c0_g3_i1.p1 TRINITY_DN6643_c0_g3~~TRINITY_DN6643_c0_g3_i1.p1  ORF type:complete len:359 (-),score=97.59 TRINITY_DN6643_c0_g3_i1:24-941(-)
MTSSGESSLSSSSSNLRNSNASNYSSPASSTRSSPTVLRSEIATPPPARSAPKQQEQTTATAPSSASLLIDFGAPMTNTPTPAQSSKVPEQSLFTDDPLFSDFNSNFASTQQQKPQQPLQPQQPQQPLQPLQSQSQQPVVFNMLSSTPSPTPIPVTSYPLVSGYGSGTNLANLNMPMVRPVVTNFVQAPMGGYVAGPTTVMATPQQRMPLQYPPMQPMMSPMAQPLQPTISPMPQQPPQQAYGQRYPSTPSLFPTTTPSLQPQYPIQQQQQQQPRPQQPTYYVGQTQSPAFSSSTNLFEDDERFS